MKEYRSTIINIPNMEHTLSINNTKVIDFYNEHKNLNFENMNVLFVDILESLLRNTNPSLDSNIATTLLDTMKTLQTQVLDMKDTVTKNQTDTGTMFTLKFIEFKREYMEDLRIILSNNTSERIGPLIKEYNDALLDKTKIMVSDIIPKNQETLYKSIENSFNVLQSGINNDTNLLMKSTLTKDVLDKFTQSLDEKFSTTIINSQSMFNSMITSTEHRLDNKLTELKDISTSNNSLNDAMCTNVNELLKKMENSSAKGKLSENLLFNVLHSLYPTAQIENVGNIKETGDIIMKRKGKPVILFENKNYDKNVVQDEVRKFLRDVEHQNCSAIMLAQRYGITNKDNFEIELHNNNVLVYLHKVEYDADKIKAAIDIIDYFKETIGEVESSNGELININKETLDEINKEYQNFINNKMIHIKTIKDFQQKLISQVDDIKLPGLEHFLSKLYASSASKENICDYCGYVAKNVRALTAHHRGCAQKKQHDIERTERITTSLTSGNSMQYNPNV
jgi:hypothetical protein